MSTVFRRDEKQVWILGENTFSKWCIRNKWIVDGMNDESRYAYLIRYPNATRSMVVIISVCEAVANRSETLVKISNIIYLIEFR